MLEPPSEAYDARHSGTPPAALIAAWIAILFLAVGLRLPDLVGAHVFTDEGARIAAAQPLTEGAMLYRDVVHVGPPGTILLNAAVLGMTANSLAAVRVSSLVVSLLSLMLVSWIAWRSFGALPSLVGAALFALSPFEVLYSGHGTSESLMALLALASVASVVGAFGSRAALRFGLAGLFAIAAGLAKQPGILAGAAIGAVLILDAARRHSARVALGNLGALGLGAALTLAAYVGWLANEGALHSAWLELTTYHDVSNAELHWLLEQPSLSEPAKWIGFVESYGLRRVLMLGGLFALIWPAALRGTTLRPLLAMLALPAAAGVFMLPQDYGVTFGHYWLMSEPWWILLTAALFRAPAFARLRAAPRPIVVACAVALAAVAVREALDLGELRRVREKSGDRTRQLEMSEALKDFDRILVLANPIHYLDTGKRPPVEPLDYFLLGELVFASAEGPEAVARLVLPSLRASDAVLMDPKRARLLAPLLAAPEFSGRLQLHRAWGGIRLFRIDAP
jgi:4-amino-4-deoxy-L-arabinose transferase-like glycosyltransferase